MLSAVDTARARGARPVIMVQIGRGVGLAEVKAFPEREGGLALAPAAGVVGLCLTGSA